MGRVEDFEDELQRLDEMDDPLAVFDNYHRFLLSEGASGESISKLLERATQRFVEDRRYRNDPRYLRLWLAYASRCRDPENVYAFLAMESICADLASYYEDYAAFLERTGDLDKAKAVLKAGVDRRAQPQERLKRTLNDFLSRTGLKLTSDSWDSLPTNPIMMSGQNEKKRPTEQSGYKKELIHTERGELSFEEVRAKSWRRTGSILKTIGASSEANNNSMLIDDFEGDFDILTPVDPDELTHVSVYKDNTADLRDLARSLNASSSSINGITSESAHSMEMQDSFDAFLNSSLTATNQSIPNNSNSNNNNSYDRRTARLSLIPEESDGGTQVSGFIPSMLRKLQAASALASPTVNPPIVLGYAPPAPSYLTASLLADHHLMGRALFMESPDLLQPKVKAVQKSIGRDGVGNNHTVASLNVACGHYFVERKLSERLYLAVDLAADVGSQSLHQSALKLVDDLWEAHLLNKLTDAPQGWFPTCLKSAKHPDGYLLCETFYSYGSLQSMLMNETIDEKLLLFWFRELVKAVSYLNTEKRIIHGALRPEHVMIRLSQDSVSPTFDPSGGRGWNGHGVAVVSYSQAIDASLLSSNIELDKELMARYRAGLGEGCPCRVSMLDIYGLTTFLEALSDSRPSLRYSDCWTNIGAMLAKSLMTNNENPFADVLSLVDSVLVPEAAVLPTLKSLLTRLEISLLERASAK